MQKEPSTTEKREFLRQNVFKANFRSRQSVSGWTVPRCFAHDGMKKINLTNEYQCGIVERILGWMESSTNSHSDTTSSGGLPDA